MTDAITDVRWGPPGDGAWHFEAAHFPRPLSRLLVELFPKVAEGWITGAKRYGKPANRMKFVTVNDYGYFGHGEEIPGDEEVAARAHRERWWNDEVRRWYEEERPAAVATNLGLQREDLEALDDDALRDHLARCIRNVETLGPLHFEHSGRNESGALLGAQCRAAGLTDDDAWNLLAASSPATRRPAELVAGIAEALRVAGVADVSSLDDVRAVPEAAVALDAYLEEFGWRIVDGYEPATPVLVERPGVIVSSIRSALRQNRPAPAPPLECPAGVDPQLLEEARAAHSVRDDDDGVCFMWPMGLLRRSVLEAGRRLEVRGRVRAADDLFDATPDELLELLAGAGPSAEDLAARADRRAWAATLSPPRVIGGPPESGDAPTPPAERARLTGTGIGSASHRGRARVVDRDTAAIELIEPGDVLIARMTGPAFNTVFPILGGVAAEEGGPGSHTAILARELGVPAVVGVPGLLDAVEDGDQVEIDARAGSVRVIRE